MTKWMFLRIPVNYIRFVSHATSSIETQAPLYQFSTFGFLRIVVIARFCPRNTYFQIIGRLCNLTDWCHLSFIFLYVYIMRAVCKEIVEEYSRFDDLHKLPVRNFQCPVTSRILTPCQYRHEREVYAVWALIPWSHSQYLWPFQINLH